jgi:hypothetical protein
MFMLCLRLPASRSIAQNLVVIDAQSSETAPAPVGAAPGIYRNSQGATLAVNSQYLVLDGKPWLPVMGEFHYSRYPEAQWEQELLKMKAAGVNIVSTYVIWIHHEQTEGRFNWSGQRDLRHFVELCGRHGLYVVVRIGPWAHAEVRNGGLPDWVLKSGPVRQNDPTYLRLVNAYFNQIGAQLHGELWKDGGPVMGVQIENEYSATGPGKGMEHIRTLKRLARSAGLDVPLYTVTGWDGAAIPTDVVLPVFGGYADAPWADTAKAMPANEVYSFRFKNRVAGSMGAIGGKGQNAAASYAGTPFLTAEVGDGLEDTYFRRPVLSADDVAAMAPVMLGSGVNLLGYYMFHGGRNPDGGAITLEESQRTGYPTDVPVRSYDFQAPLGEFGQARESLRKLKLVHYFLNDFGDALAPMETHAPVTVPRGPADVLAPRVAARTSGERGFVFFNNHVRGVTMPARRGFQVELKLPGETVRVPETPITLPANAYGIWPVNLPIGQTVLRYSTAQLFKRVVNGNQTSLWFFAVPGVTPELMLSPGASVLSTSANVLRGVTREGVRLRVPQDQQATIALAGDTTLVILSEPRAEDIWRVDDPEVLLSTAANVFSDGHTWTLSSEGVARVLFGVYGTNVEPKTLTGQLQRAKSSGLFQQYVGEVPRAEFAVSVSKTKDAGPRTSWTMGPKLPWREPVPVAPDENDFQAAAEWEIDLPNISWSPSLSDAFLHIDYSGDVATLRSKGELLDDNFWKGLPWSVGLRELSGEAGSLSKSELELRIFPLPQKFPMYIERANQLRFTEGVAGALHKVQIVPEYRIVLQEPAAAQ